MCASTNPKTWRLLLFLGILAILAQSAHCATFPNVLFHMQDFTTQNVTNKSVEIFPYSTPFSTNSAVITNDRKRYTTDTTGSFTVTNMVPGCYKIQSQGSWTITPFNICFTNETGNLNAHDLMTTVVTVVDANKKFVQQTFGVLASPTNFFHANLFPGLNVTFATNALGQLTISASTNGVSVANAVIHDGTGALVTPTNFFRANFTQGSNVILAYDALGKVIFNATSSAGGSGTVWTNSIDIWLSTRTDADGDGSMGNPRRADTVAAFDGIMRAYAAQSNITFRMHPGRYYTQGFCPDAPVGGRWQMGRNWRVIGAGIDQSILILTNTIGGSSSSRRFYHVIGSDISVDSSYSEVSDLTVDCNLDNLTVVGTTNVYKTIAAVKLNGSHTAIRRVKTVHYGADGLEISGINDDVFVLSTAATFPQYAPRASHTVIEDCIMLYPSKLTTDNIVEFIHTSGAFNVANGLTAFTTNIIIRNNYIDGRFEDGTIKTRAFNTDLWHAITMGSCELGIVEGNHVQNVDVGGSYQDSFRTRSIICRNNTYLDVDAGGLWTFTSPTGEPAGGLAVTGIITTGTTAVMTIAQASHDLVPGIDIVQVSGATDSAYNSSFLVSAATATTITFELPALPTDPTPAGTILWRVHRGVRDILYTGNTTLLRHGLSTDVGYAVGMIGPFTHGGLPIFHNVVISDNYFAFSDGKATNNPNTGSVGIYVRNAKNAIIKNNLINLYTNTPGLAQRENIYTTYNSNVVAFNNRSFDGVMVPAHDANANKFYDALSSQEYRLRETNGGLEYLQFQAGVMASNVFYVWPTTNGSLGNVLVTDGAHPAKLSWGNGSAGISLLDGFGTNLTLRASTNSGGTNLILRAIAAQEGDLMSAVSAGGNIVMAVSTNGHLRVGTGSTTTTSISRVADYGDGIAFDVDVTRFLVNTQEVANVANTTGIAHLGNNAAFTLGSAGDVNLRRISAGALNLSASNSLTGDGLLQLAKVRFVENQGSGATYENTQYVELLATNMAATYVMFLPQTNGLAGQVLTTRQVDGITNILFWTNVTAGVSGASNFISTLNGIGTNLLHYGQNFVATNSSLVFSNITSILAFTNSQVQVNGLGIWTNSAITSVPLMADSIAGLTTNLFALRKTGTNVLMVNADGKLLIGDGAVATPAIARVLNPGDGMYLGAGFFGFSTNGVSFARINSGGSQAGFQHTHANPGLVFGPSGESILYKGLAGEFIFSTPGATITNGLGSLIVSNAMVRGALTFRENETPVPDNSVTLKLPPTVDVPLPITTFLWITNGAVGQALKTTGSQLYWDDVGGGSPGIVATDGTGTRTTFGPGVTTGASLVLRNVALQTGPALVLTNSAGTAALMMITNTGSVLVGGHTNFPGIASIFDPRDGITITNDLMSVSINGLDVLDVGAAGISHLSDTSYISFGATNDVRISRFSAGNISLNWQGTDTRGSLSLSNITALGKITHAGSDTYPAKTITLGGAGTTAPGRVDGSLGNFFTITLGSSTNLVLTNVLEGPLTVVITNPAAFTVTWDGMRTNAWLGRTYTNQPPQALAGVTYWTFYKQGITTNGSAVSTKVPFQPYENLTFAATQNLDFDSNPEQVLTMTGDLTSITTSGKSANVVKPISVLVIAGASARAVAAVPNWRWMTPSITNGVAINSRGVLTLKSYNTADTEVQAWWNPQQ